MSSDEFNKTVYSIVKRVRFDHHAQYMRTWKLINHKQWKHFSGPKYEKFLATLYVELQSSANVEVSKTPFSAVTFDPLMQST